MNNSKRVIASILACGLVAGCAQLAWAPGPNAQGSFDQAKAQCSLMARHGGGSYYAQGTPAFVGGAMAGAAIGEAIRAQADFNDCMSASGWIAMGAKNKKSLAAEGDKIKVVSAENRMCLATARANPKYTPILSHLVDLNTQRYTLSQMANMSLPTEDEAKMLAALGDESAECWSKEEAGVNAVEPGLIPLLRAAHGMVNDLNLRLVQRQISWGQYDKAVQDINEQAKSGRMPTMPVIAPAMAAASGPAGNSGGN